MAENENSVSDAAMRSALDLVFQTQLATSDAKRALRGAEDDLEDAEDRTGAAERELKDANKFLNELQGLPDLREELAGLEVELDVLTEGLPSSVRGVNSLTSVDEDVSTEDRESLGDRLDVKSSLVAKNGSLWRIQLHSGLVGFEPIKSAKFGGLAMSLIIGIAGIAISFPLGIVLALGRQSDMFIVKTLSVGYIEFIRGVPLITLLFVASVLLNYFMPKGTNFDILLRVVIMVTLFAAAYMAEVIRGGLAALPTGQYEAADALGLDYWKSMQLIIMPQALKIAIPGIVGTFIGLFKDTTLVSIIGLLDPVGLTIAIRGDSDWNGIVWELYLFIAIMFWVFTFSMSRYSMYLERKLQTGH
ncbi:MAG: ABC transporter permease subunit [Rhodobacteraceae bacterium]|nr:ABC transporter permease subunit [Paracoccaceae bacterium]